MTLLKTHRWSRVNSLKSRAQNPFVELFHRLEGKEVFPYNLAWECFNQLKQTTQSREELLVFLLEDILFTSLYATFYEALLLAIHDNPEFSKDLIEQFQEDAPYREQIIAEQAFSHFKYIENHGVCEGCSHCEYHSDVDEVIEHWIRGDIQFFIDLYVGMNTIQFAFENIVFDVIPYHQDFIKELSQKNIIDFRKSVYSYAEYRLHQTKLN